MPIKVKCRTCGSAFNAPDSAAGKKTKCPKCGGIIEIPEPAPPEPDPLGDIFDAEVAPQWGFDDEDLQVEQPVEREAEEPDPRTQRPCPMCGEMINRSAVKCRFCGEVFDPELKKRSKKKSRGYSDDDSDLTLVDWLLCIFCSGIGCIVGIVYAIQGKPKGGKMILISIVVNILFGVFYGSLPQ